ncbi:MAG: NUDIX hydrolase [Chloroflexi bacterium]|nr:NUDIX hydrolase [Chloroflexota bacterium]
MTELESVIRSPWTCLERRIALDGGAFVVRQDEVLDPSGAPRQYTFAQAKSDFTCVVPVDERGLTCLVRQWRYTWEASSWEVPAGTLEREEEPLTGAQRELLEEVGLRARQWSLLTVVRPSASIAVNGYVYLAQGLTEHAPDREASETDMVSRWLPLDDALEAASNGRIQHSVSIAALFLAARALRSRSR